MDGYDHRSIEKTIAKALEQLHAHNFCTLGDYEQLVSSGVLVKKPLFASDYEFQMSYPNHPLSANSLTPRMQAGDAIRDTVKQLRQPLRQDLLDGIHTALFDCSGAVRHSLAQALIFTDSPISVPHLQELIRIEKQSKLVLAAAGAALINAQMDTEGYVQPGDKLIMLVSRREDLIIRLSEVAEQTGSKLFLPRREFSELTDLRSEVQVVDRWFMGEESWEAFCQYLRQVSTENNIPLRGAEGQTSLGEAIEHPSPLIIVDHHMRSSRERFQSPSTPPESVFYLEGGPDDLVGELVYRSITNGNLSLEDICDTVNRRRMSW